MIIKPLVLKIIITLSAVAVISRTFPRFSFFYYLLIPLFLIIIFAGYKLILKDRLLRNTLILFAVFGLWAGITSLWSSYPGITLTRAGYFIFISFGALLAGYLWQHHNYSALSFLLAANIIVIILSLFSLITNIPADSWTGGNEKGFMGFAGHQNTLASAILFTVPSVFTKILIQKSSIINLKSGSRNKTLLLTPYFFLLTINLLFLILTYSRASIAALIAGAVIFLIVSKKWNLLVYSSAAALLIFSLLWFSPSLRNNFNNIIKKDDPAFYSTRQWLWEPSYNAALSGGIAGLGYGISHPGIIVEGTGSHYENGRYIREKGNSFLALIEETGVIGFILFLLPVVYISCIRHPASGIRNPASGILPASLLVFLLHSQFEAWMVGVGSIQLPLFFFFVGQLVSMRTMNST